MIARGRLSLGAGDRGSGRLSLPTGERLSLGDGWGLDGLFGGAGGGGADMLGDIGLGPGAPLGSQGWS